ncbi:endospore germination permease [Mycoplasmatota bacterium]|nr:endospore germination permease [Mycoplasmatota bacterium]
MLDKVKISSFQLSVLIIGFTLGSSTIFNPAFMAGSDAWMVIVLSLLSGIVLIAIFSYISILNPGKTLIGILTDVFGKIIGKFIAGLYIWYFIHLLSLVIRNFMEFISATIYYETPMLFISSILVLVCAYKIKKGLEVMARVAELLIPIIIMIIFLLLITLISKYDVSYFFPVLDKGLKPVLKASFLMMTFPYGELVAFLMIFPHLNKQKNVFKIASISVILAGLLLLVVTLRTLLVLGPMMVSRIIYPSFISVKFVPEIHIEVLSAINLLIGGATKGCVLFYSIVMGIAQILKLDDYKPFVLPISTILVGLSLWLYESFYEQLSWAEEIYPFYALPFQIIIPIYVLIISYKRNKKNLNN